MKYILLSGINRYDRQKFGANNDLKECVNDVMKFRYQLDPADKMVLLKDETATKQNILDALQEFSRVAEKGDTVIWHQSSHGTYYDDAKGRINIRLAHDGYLYDYEIAEMMARFERGVTCLLFSDCCYSHSNSRDVPEPGMKARSVAYRGAPPVIEWAQYVRNTLATIYYLSACGPDQVAYESPSEGGYFTTKLIREMARSKRPRRITTIMNAVKKSLTVQTPTVEVINSKGAKIPMF